MDATYASALAALAGSAIGALSSFATTWLGQNVQHARSRAERDQARREAVYGEFIDQASTLYGDAVGHEMHDVTGLVRLYSLVNRMKLFASSEIIAHAEHVVGIIVSTYGAPNRTIIELQQGIIEKPDPLREFSSQCRLELNAAFRG